VRAHCVPAFLVVLGCAAGCVTPPPSALRAPPAPPGPASSAEAWWTSFADPALDRLMAEARANNRDLEQAAARLDEARARARIAGAEGALRADAVAVAARTRSSESVETPLPPGPRNRYAPGVDMRYEVDLWGRIRSTREAARQQVLVSEAERAALELSLLGRVAAAYFEQQAAMREVALIEAQLAGYADAEQVNRARADAGLSSELDAQRVAVERAVREGERSDALLTARLAAHRLDVLCGRAPGSTVPAPPRGEAVIPVAPDAVGGERLERRPDVAAARAAWERALAQARSAHAAFRPSLVLSGSIGYEASAFEELFDWRSRLWSLAGGLSAPLLEGGRIRGEYDVAVAQVRAATAAYEETMLVAYREVADALQAIDLLAAQLRSVETGCAAASRALDLSRERYAGGFVSYLEVVESERSLLAAQRTKVQVGLGLQLAHIDLLRALSAPL
jgi:NodT family efflux transporter outer membrane factor (OMF) lipoprotein